MRMIGSIVVLVYVLVGVLVANNHHYFSNVNGLKGVISAILAVILWPLVLLGVNLHIGSTGGKGRAGAMSAFLPKLRTGPRGRVV